MSTPYGIRYLPAAEKDLEEIFEYIIQDNPSAASALLERFDKAIARQADAPEIGVRPKDENLRIAGYRILIVGRYLVFYVIKGNIVQIRRIIHGARQYEGLL